MCSFLNKNQRLNFFKVIYILNIFCLIFAFCQLHSLADNGKGGKNGKNESLFKGYITNKNLKSLNLSVFQIDKESFFLTETSLDDNSYIPTLNLKITAENADDYVFNVLDEEIFIPKLTKFTGYISEIIPPKAFNRKGFFVVSFDKAICPTGEEIHLKSNIASKSAGHIYNPISHIGKTTLSLLGGSLAGTLFSYQLGGLGLAFATHGYSLAAGAAAGGFIGTVVSLSDKGKNASIEPGDKLTIAPLNDISLDDLKEIKCPRLNNNELAANASEQSDKNKDTSINIEVISVKQKKDFSGDTAFKIDIKFKNDSKTKYRSSNFYLRDSQGKEYSTTFTNLTSDIFIDFPPKVTKVARLEFLVEHPKTSHWLILKDNNFHEVLGSWKLERKI